MADHPLPWSWNKGANGDEILVDALGSVVLEDAAAYGGILCASPYVRAVTERAGAMEALLRAARDRSGEHYAGPFWEECDALLAEIDKAKAGG